MAFEANNTRAAMPLFAMIFSHSSTWSDLQFFSSDQTDTTKKAEGVSRINLKRLRHRFDKCGPTPADGEKIYMHEAYH